MSEISDYQSYVVDQKLSGASKVQDLFIKAINNIGVSGYDFVPELICGAIGQSSESAELLEEVLKTYPKKLVEELGDVYYYLNVSAEALNLKFLPYTPHYYVDVAYNTALTPLQIVQQISVNAGKYLDIVKKLLFQGKPYTPMIQATLIELILKMYHYINHLCSLMSITLEDLIQENRDKLDRRYKTEFTVNESENKK
jgi:NTP pyrophosphatase (non-canonical NTP hydrolase)